MSESVEASGQGADVVAESDWPRTETAGDWAKPGLPVLVFLHGMGGSINNFAAVFRATAERYPVLAVELPGHALSPEVPGGEQGMVEVLEAALVAKLGDRQVVMVPHSLGMHFAVRLIERGSLNVARIVGVSGGIFTVAEVARGGLRAVLRHPLRALGIAGALLTSSARPSPKFCDALNRGRQHWLLWPYLKPHLTRRAPFVGDSFRDQGGPSARRLLKLAAMVDYRGLVEACPVPMEFVFGARDPLTGPRDHDIARGIAGADAVAVYPESGHWPQVELPERVTAAVLAAAERAAPPR